MVLFVFKSSTLINNQYIGALEFYGLSFQHKNGNNVAKKVTGAATGEITENRTSCV
jgi:hypothetical protein